MVMRLLVIMVCFAVLGYAGCQKDSAKVEIEFRLAESEPASGLTEATYGPTGESVFVHAEAVLTNEHVESAVVSTRQGRSVVEITLTDGGSERLARFTREHVGKYMAMLLDGKLLSAPIIRAPITGNRAVIDGGFSEEEAQRVAQGITRE